MQQPFAFVHIPKNGGETIDLLLGIPKDHSPAWQQRQRMGADAWNRTPYRFAIVRNPWDRMVSWYAHLRKHTYIPELRDSTSSFGRQGDSYRQLEKGVPMLPAAHRELAVVSSFPVWVKRVLTDPKFMTWSAVDQLGVHNTQVSMLSDPTSGELIVTHVYMFEAFRDALVDICTRTGGPIQLHDGDHANNSIHDAYETYYDQEAIDLVGMVFADDVRAFGYKPPPV